MVVGEGTSVTVEERVMKETVGLTESVIAGL